MDFVKTAFTNAVQRVFSVDVPVDITRPDEQFGDFSTNVAMQLAKQQGANPREIANQLVQYFESEKPDWLQAISIAGPGFINVTISDAMLTSLAVTTVPQTTSGQIYVVEYSCPNAFKELHAGHLYQTIAGDVIARLLEQSGAHVFRTNFGGDVGLHVAKAMWGIIQALGGESPDALTAIEAEDRAGFLSKAYVHGAAAYESDADAHQLIDTYNQAIYTLHADNDTASDFARIYWTCRQWSYDYFDDFYKYIDVSPFRYYPESTTAGPGLALVNDGLERGIFEHSDGAIVYRGEKVGLHTRVFVTQAGLPTYETKDLGVISLEYQDYTFNHRILITGRDQAEYMKVVFAAASELLPAISDDLVHLTNGIIKFADGTKMSSRLGNVTSAHNVLEAVAENIDSDDPTTKRALMLGAVKYTFLRQRLGGDISFDPVTSVSVHGNSGPYLQYALVRARSILAKAGEGQPLDAAMIYEPSERQVVRMCTQFQDVVAAATAELAPHLLCTYLYDLASAFNVFYEHNRVLDDPRSALRLAIVAHYAAILDKGLELLGIERLERM